VVVPGLILLVGIVVIWLSLRRILLHSAKVANRWRRVVERIILSGVILFAFVIAGCASYNAIVLAWFRAHNPPPGESYAVDGYKMHIYCSGSGTPTIVLDAGLGNDALIWGAVQPELSRTTRVCAYDRAGFGWSDARPAPRDADHIAQELHGLLMHANVTGPVVLMGHSISGIYMRDYATRYPADVSGIVFVDGSTPLQQDNPAFKAAAAAGPPQWLLTIIMKSAYIAGIPRLFGECSQPFPGFDAHTAKLQAEDMCHPQFGGMAGEMDNFHRSGEETVHAGPYGALPILVFSQDPGKTKGGMPPQMASAWNQMQEDLKKLSTRSRRIIARDSTHYIQLDRADLLKKEVPTFIEQIRGTAPQPAILHFSQAQC
jgi:pimeloyl-ACP methyl ester carboxylesterase